MWIAASGIITKKVQYEDNKFILHVITSDHGYVLFSYSLPKSSKSKRVFHILNQPLPIVQFRYFNNPNNSVKYLRDLYLEYVFKNLFFQPQKLQIILVINEILTKTAQKNTIDKKLFTFISSVLKFIDQTNNTLKNFPIWFLLQYFRQIGIGPSLPDDDNACFFDIIAGRFFNTRHSEVTVLDKELSNVIKHFLKEQYDSSIEISDKQKQFVLDTLIKFFNCHTSENIYLETIKYL